MPFINISTSEKVDDRKKLLVEVSDLISSLTKKSKRFVMAKLDDNSQIYFADDGPACFLEIKSIGSLNTSEIVKPLCSFVHEKLGIPIDKIYICFNEVPAEMWGWNGRTFG